MLFGPIEFCRVYCISVHLRSKSWVCVGDGAGGVLFGMAVWVGYTVGWVTGWVGYFLEYTVGVLRSYRIQPGQLYQCTFNVKVTGVRGTSTRMNTGLGDGVGGVPFGVAVHRALSHIIFITALTKSSICHCSS